MILNLNQHCYDCRSAFHDPSDATKYHGIYGKAFDIPTYVLKHTMNGQTWEEGDAVFHSHISASTLIIHGKEDKLITEEDEEEMVDVRIKFMLH